MKPPSKLWDGKIAAGPNSCCLFTGYIMKSGYGQIHRHEYAHRRMWEECFGEIPKGLHVLHKCNVKRCVNPNHLYLGTNADNHRDRVAAGKSVNPPSNFGRNHSEETRRKISAGLRRHWRGDQ